ncbi:hypothetical protein BLNAU_1409 [Blattamonas nauphoetae]|uniref:SH3 domain-containing protein n=1 Tax=Blattamonas nauphoetae TaxID=2049346 RepID=A0ABQ9YJB5_9EUKA|nr:hypothetical protein BLNAU_1409 [Blattamonas nauphoetae]
MASSYQSPSDINFQENLWEGQSTIFTRGHQGSEALRLAAFRCLKHHMASVSFMEEIKSRKFEPLPEKRSLGTAWDAMKAVVVDVENLTKAVATRFDELNKQLTHEREEYDKACKQLESDHNSIKKKRADHISLVEKKKHSYENAFKDWDQTEGEYQKALTGGDQKVIQKLMKASTSKNGSKNQAEADYAKAVKDCNVVETEYDNTEMRILITFEELETKRINVIKEKLSALWTEWTTYLTTMSQYSQQGLATAQTIDTHADLVGFATESRTGKGHAPHQVFHACQRTHGPNVATSTSMSQPQQQQQPQSAALSSSSSQRMVVVAAYDFTAQEQTEITITAGEEISVEKPDNGQGWTFVRKKDGSEGFVPTNHIMEVTPEQHQQMLGQSTQLDPEPAAAPPLAETGGGQPATALYDYAAGGEGEMSLTAGETITVVPGDDPDWILATNSTGQSGYVPLSFIQLS